MATLGNSASPVDVLYSEADTQNQISPGSYTMPVNGVVSDVVFYAKGFTGTVVAQGIVWNSTGGIMAGGTALTLPSAGGVDSVGGQQWNDSGGMSLYIAAGAVIWPGWWRAPSGTCVWSTSSGTGTYGGNTSAEPTTYSAVSMGAGSQALCYIIYTPSDPPTVTTVAATNITGTSALLNGTINPNGLTASSSFAWGPTSGVANILNGAVYGETGSSALAESWTLSGLSPSTTYYFQFSGSNSGGAVYGSVLSFTTLAAAPYAPISLSPSSGSVDLTIAETLSWSAFSSPIGGDTQASYTLRWNVNGGSWNTIGPTSSSAAFDTIAANTFTAGSISWQVQVTGTAGYTSAWSALAYFTATVPPAPPAITVPTLGFVIPTSTFTVDWTG